MSKFLQTVKFQFSIYVDVIHHRLTTYNTKHQIKLTLEELFHKALL